MEMNKPGLMLRKMIQCNPVLANWPRWLFVIVMAAALLVLYLAALYHL